MTAAQGDVSADHTDDAGDGRLFCYRHPDRETWVRCGRCDRPICTQCAMQGPVGFRCRECGRPVRDPMSSFTPTQLLGGLAVSFGGGLLTALIANRFGFFALFVAFFAGGLIAQAITRVTGYKMGVVMDVLMYGGIVAGALVAFWFMNADFISLLLAHGASAGGRDGQPGVGNYLAESALWAAIGAVVTCVGARSRMR
ncbi:MAG TPA: hypothetical protein VIR16_08760 [Candidatus Limnocylindrales bacterium]